MKLLFNFLKLIIKFLSYLIEKQFFSSNCMEKEKASFIFM